MSIWDRFKSRLQKPAEPEAIQDEYLSGQLEGLHFSARPEFRDALKDRLMNSLATSAPVSSTRPAWFQKWRLVSAPLAVGGLGLLAAIIVLVSVVSVNGISSVTPTPIAEVASAATVTPDEPSFSVPQSDLNQFYDAVSQSNQKRSEAEAALGFPVRAPGYVPEGYRMDYAALQVPPGPGSPSEVSGYYLRYSKAAPVTRGSKPTEKNYELEISEWRVPFNLAARTATSSTPTGPSVQISGAQRYSSQSVKGAAGYLIEGGRWRIQLQGQPGRPETVLPTRPNQPQNVTPGVGFPGRPPMAGIGRGRPVPPVMFGRTMPNRADYFIELMRGADQRGSKTLIWQQGNLLTVVSVADSLSNDELKQIAESLAGSKQGN